MVIIVYFPLTAKSNTNYRNMGKSGKITFSNTEVHREVTDTHRVKESDLCGSRWFSVYLCVSS